MKFLLLSRVLNLNDIEAQVSENPAALGALAQFVLEAVSSGYRPTLEDLEGFLPCERAALAHASARVAGDTAVRHAVAGSGPIGMALASGDPEVRDDIALGIGLASAVQAARGMEPAP